MKERERERRAQRKMGDTLDPAELTRFMGTYHDQNQSTLAMTRLQVTDDMNDSI